MDIFKDLSRKEFAEKFGVHRVTAGRILRGERFKKIKELFLNIYTFTDGKVTPNDILGIPPQQGGIK